MDNDCFIIDTGGNSGEVNDEFSAINTEGDAEGLMDNNLFFIDTQGDDESTKITKVVEDKRIINQSSSGKYSYDTGNVIPLGSETPVDKQIEDTAPRIRRQNFPRHMNKRYHESENLNMKLKPGVMSQELCDALGLGPNQLPLHIYRMRALGYPPGWLKKVEVSKGELSIIEHNGSVDENSKQTSYNFDDLIEYPGFNVLPGQEYRDQYLEIGAYPIQEYHQLDNFKRILQENGYVPTQQPKYDEDRSSKVNRTNSTNDMSGEESLDYLEKERQRLLLELSRSEDSTNGHENSLDESNHQSELDQANNTDLSSSSVTEELGFGSPVLHSVKTPLPSLEKWSLGVSDHRPFENLPNSEGRFDLLNEAIKKCRESHKSCSSLEEMKKTTTITSTNNGQQEMKRQISSDSIQSSSYPNFDNFATPLTRDDKESFSRDRKYSSHSRSNHHHNRSSPYSKSQSNQGYRRY